MDIDHLLGIKDFSELQDTNIRILNYILDAVNSGIIILDGQEHIVFLNSKARSLLEYEKLPVKGKHLAEIFMEEDRQVLVPNILKLAREKGEFEGDVMLKRGKGSSFVAFLSIYFWEKGDQGTFIITFNDISRLKGVERLLKRSERMVYLGRMLDDISHQIRNPVLAIGGFSRRLLKTRLEKPDYVKIIIEESRRLEMLLDVLTRFIQLPKPRFSMLASRQIKDLAYRLCEEITSQYDVELRTTHARFTQDAMVVTDIALFRQAFEPVVINACEAFLDSDKKPRVILKLNCQDAARGGVKIEISDSGSGISPPLLPRIFHPFFSTKTGHLGMGLTFTKRIMDELEGEVDVKSALNQGTVVTMRLPGDRRRSIRTTPI